MYCWPFSGWLGARVETDVKITAEQSVFQVAAIIEIISARRDGPAIPLSACAFLQYYCTRNHTMPRTYYCKKCGDLHEPPTGRQCRLREHQHVETTDNDALMTILNEIKGKIVDIDSRVKRIEDPEQSDDKETRRCDPKTQGPSLIEEKGQASSATPQTLRDDARLMSQATNRLARLQMDDSEDEDLYGKRDSRRNGKKSGSLMTAAETVERRIDWPQLYVHCVTAGRRKPVAYANLKIEEFVFRFLAMIDSPKIVSAKPRIQKTAS